MGKFLVHGSKKKGFDALEPISMFGENGSVDGIGINLTSDIDVALRYAGDSGSVYVVDVDTDNFIEISDSSLITEEQAEFILGEIRDLHHFEQYRLYTDMCGHVTHKFNDKYLAFDFYTKEKEEAKNYHLDRLKPKVEDKGDGFEIRACRKSITEADLVGVSHKDAHYILNLFDNEFATRCYKHFASGLVLPKLNNGTNYLSFAYLESVEEEIDLSTLSNSSEGKQFVQERLSKLETGVQDVEFEIDRYKTLFIDDKGKIYESSDEIRYPLQLKTELEIEMFPRPHIWVEKDAGKSDALTRALGNLLRSKPEFSEFELRFDNYRVPLKDYLNEVQAPKTEIGYHGTCTGLIESIGLAGLVPRDISGIEAHYIGSAKKSESDRVYFTSKEGLGAAIAGARSAAKSYGGSPIILEFPLESLDINLLAPDEDSKKDCATKSLESIGTAAYKGKIDSSQLKICVEEFVPEDMRQDFQVSLANSLFEIAKQQTLAEACETSVALSNYLTLKL
ncbi:hypothetical protein [Vibrio sp. D431a]|uniref:hypothetical protein n=1 Tax=Vibrio sp. D431a TaxID=2837388 RepID=UPI0025557AA2|nr:hypothetical protein [Vibrio sp. D431a]MDK9790111.1 hypothetical protein [Vibrio sp. D431a]